MAIEAILFAAAEPLGVTELRRILRRHLSEEEAPEDALDMHAAGDADGPGDAHTGAAPDAQAADPSAAADAILLHADEAAAPTPLVAQEAGIDAGADAWESAFGQAEATLMLAPEAAGSASPAQDPAAQTPTPASDETDAFGHQANADAAFALTPSPAPTSGRPAPLGQQIRAALTLLERRWAAAKQGHGFALMQVAGGYTFRTRGRFARLLGAMSRERPARLSRPALESLAIVAYRQPVTKPEVDALRGVDSGGTMKLLLERKLIATVGKKDEPGRPLLYGTTPTFLSQYNLANLAALPSLREFNELNEDSEDALRAFDGLPSLAELARDAPALALGDEPAVGALDEAVLRLRDTEGLTHQALLLHGVALSLGDDAQAGANRAEALPPAQAPSTLH